MMASPLSIAITADPELPVPPVHYGGIERIIAMLVDGLVARGHRVTLFANAASRVPCRLVPYRGMRSRSLADSFRNMALVAGDVRHRPVDVVHSFGRLAYLLPILPARLPKVMSYQRAVTPRTVRLAQRLSRGSLRFTACSRRLVEHLPDRRSWHVVYNGVPVERYTYRAEVASDAPLVFLGRVEHIKGAHVAVDVARRTGRPLVIAGTVAGERVHEEYFRDRIQPYVDGQRIRYVGPVDDRQKDDLLGGAAALLMPILWEEPFGIVMAEALACGTPVLGFRRGSVPEVVEHAATGFMCETVDEMAAAVERIPEIDRGRCRRAAEERFGQAAVVTAYEDVYRTALASVRSRQRPATGGRP